MEDPFDGLGPKPLSRFRIIGLVFFVLLILGFYAYTTPDSIGHAYITGRCFRTPLPSACRFRSQREFVPPDLLNGAAAHGEPRSGRNSPIGEIARERLG